MRFDLLALDLDDTLLHSDLSISAANREALRAAHRGGAKIVLASGRSIFSMERYAVELGLDGPDDYLIASNGAEIIETASRRILDGRRIPPELCRVVAAEVDRRGFPWQLYVDGRILYRNMNEWTAEDNRLTGLPMEPIVDVEALLATGQIKFVIPGDPATVLALRDELRDFLGGRCEVLISKPCFLEVLPAGVDKGVALSRLAGILGIPLGRCLACGDAANDLGMLRQAGLGCAPANAIPEVRAAAGWVSTRSNDEDFVAEVIGRFMTGDASGNGP